MKKNNYWLIKPLVIFLPIAYILLFTDSYFSLHRVIGIGITG